MLTLIVVPALYSFFDDRPLGSEKSMDMRLVVEEPV
jgi:hypothetical protein